MLDQKLAKLPPRHVATEKETAALCSVGRRLAAAQHVLSYSENARVAVGLRRQRNFILRSYEMRLPSRRRSVCY